ncbi:hypothetical protein ACIQB5_38365, partial [Streptomyces sp. NPDC088560]
MAAGLAKHPDVLAAYWDGGLARLVIQTTQDAVTDRVVDRATELAGRQKLERPEEDVLEPAHPGHTGGIRSGALALFCDAVGISTAVAARTVRLKQGPRLLTAGVALLREDPRIRTVLRRRLGRSATDLVLAAVNAAANGIGQSPTALALDAALRAGQLAEAVARAAAFDAAHDTVCAPERLSLAGREVARPPLHRYPGEEYRDQAVTGALLGAAGALLFTRDVHESAEALLAGNPKAARRRSRLPRIGLARSAPGECPPCAAPAAPSPLARATAPGGAGAAADRRPDAGAEHARGFPGVRRQGRQASRARPRFLMLLSSGRSRWRCDLVAPSVTDQSPDDV